MLLPAVGGIWVPTGCGAPTWAILVPDALKGGQNMVVTGGGMAISTASGLFGGSPHSLPPSPLHFEGGAWLESPRTRLTAVSARRGCTGMRGACGARGGAVGCGVVAHLWGGIASMAQCMRAGWGVALSVPEWQRVVCATVSLSVLVEEGHTQCGV